MLQQAPHQVEAVPEVAAVVVPVARAAISQLPVQAVAQAAYRVVVRPVDQELLPTELTTP